MNNRCGIKVRHELLKEFKKIKKKLLTNEINCDKISKLIENNSEAP